MVLHNMKTYRKQVAIISGASSMVYKVVNPKEALGWIKDNLTANQQAIVITRQILVEVPTLEVSRP